MEALDVGSRSLERTSDVGIESAEGGLPATSRYLECLEADPVEALGHGLQREVSIVAHLLDQVANGGGRQLVVYWLPFDERATIGF